MTTDLWMLVAAAALQQLFILAAATPRMTGNGVWWSLRNRDTPSREMPPWADRVQRASNNLAENLILFAIVVLVVHATGRANATSALGAQIFLGARLAHAAVYAAGIPVVRTIVWALGVAGTFMVASALF